MNSKNTIKEIVKKKYGEIATSSGGCCGSGSSCCDPGEMVNFAEGYDQLDGYEKDADLGLGCGLPVRRQSQGEVGVLDRGCLSGSLSLREGDGIDASQVIGRVITPFIH